MENKNKYLWILTLASLALGSILFNNTYAQTEVVMGDNQVVIDEKQEEPIKITLSGTLEAAHNLGLKRPAKTDFTASMIQKEKTGKDVVDNVCFDAGVKLGFEKNFYLEDKKAKGVMEFSVDRDSAKLGKLYFEIGNWAVGIKENNFCHIAAFSSEKVLQLSWNKQLTPIWTIGLDVEESKKFQAFGEKDENKLAIEGCPVTPRRDLPAASGRLEYIISEEFGSVEVSTLVRPMGFHNKRSGDTKYEIGYGFNLGFNWHIKPKVDKLSINAIFGDGIGSYIPDLKKLAKEEPTNAYVKAVNLETETIKSWGVYVNFEHRFVPALRLSISGGLTNILNEVNRERVDKPSITNNFSAHDYKLGIYGIGGLMYWITEQTGVGLEYGVGMRKDMNKDTKQAQHLKAVAEFKL